MKLKNESVENVTWFLGELHAGGAEIVESDEFDVACNDDAFCTVSITDLAKDAKVVIESKAADLYQANKRIEELEGLNRKLQLKNENLKEKIEGIGYSYRKAIQERDDLKVLKFKRFNNEECWIYQGDGEDYLESLICPVVISPGDLINIIESENK